MILYNARDGLYILTIDLFESCLLLQNSKLLRSNTQTLFHFVFQFRIIGYEESLN